MTLSAVSNAAQEGAKPAVPREPVAAIIDAFQSHAVVALGLGTHNNEQGHAFLVALVRDPRFPTAANDIVVECGNARYQDVMDRFVNGDDVPDDSLRLVWQNTTQPHPGCDVPIHEQLYRAVRAINASLRPEGRLRILLGDPPIDWDSPTRREERQKWMEMRDSHPASVIQREVPAKGRRALIVYGQMHLQRKQLLTNYDMTHPVAHTVVSLLEAAGVDVFSIWGNTHADLDVLQPDVTSWPKPSFVLLRGSRLGAADFAFFYPLATNRMGIRDGKVAPIPRNEWTSLAMENQFDALLYLGPRSEITIARLAPRLCADRAYMKMRLGRLAEEGPQVELNGLKEYCASVQPR